jgi:hypothetical protein
LYGGGYEVIYMNRHAAEDKRTYCLKAASLLHIFDQTEDQSIMMMVFSCKCVPNHATAVPVEVPVVGQIVKQEKFASTSR